MQAEYAVAVLPIARSAAPGAWRDRAPTVVSAASLTLCGGPTSPCTGRVY